MPGLAFRSAVRPCRECVRRYDAPIETGTELPCRVRLRLAAYAFGRASDPCRRASPGRPIAPTRAGSPPFGQTCPAPDLTRVNRVTPGALHAGAAGPLHMKPRLRLPNPPPVLPLDPNPTRRLHRRRIRNPAVQLKPAGPRPARKRLRIVERVRRRTIRRRSRNEQRRLRQKRFLHRHALSQPKRVMQRSGISEAPANSRQPPRGTTSTGPAAETDNAQTSPAHRSEARTSYPRPASA